MSDQRFFDLAMKVIAQQASEAERAELDALAGARAGVARGVRAAARRHATAAKILPLVNAHRGGGAGNCPPTRAERLQTKVRETLGRPQSPPPLRLVMPSVA